MRYPTTIGHFASIHSRLPYRRQERRIAGNHRLTAHSIQQMNRQVWCDFSFDAFKLLAALAFTSGTTISRSGTSGAKAGPFQEIGTKHFDFCTTAARQQCQTVGIVRDPQHFTGTIFIWI